MSLQKALQKAEGLFPKGSKVQFSGQYINGFQKGTGTVTGYSSNGYVRVVVQSDIGTKHIIVADPEDENFTYDPCSISLIE